MQNRCVPRRRCINHPPDVEKCPAAVKPLSSPNPPQLPPPISQPRVQQLHGGAAVGALPGGLQIREVVHHPLHLLGVQRPADHDAGPARPARQHRAHPAAKNKETPDGLSGRSTDRSTFDPRRGQQLDNHSSSCLTHREGRTTAEVISAAGALPAPTAMAAPPPSSSRASSSLTSAAPNVICRQNLDAQCIGGTVALVHSEMLPPYLSGARSSLTSAAPNVICGEQR